MSVRQASLQQQLNNTERRIIMTDKVQKIKDWISKEQDGLMDANGNFEYPEHEGAYHILCNLDTYIDSLQEEPVSEDLEEAAKRYSDNENPICTCTECLLKSFKDGAEWQKQQFEKNRLAHCDELTAEQAQIESDFVIEHLKENNRTPTFIDAIEYGMKVQEEKVMKDATEVTVHIEAGNYPYIPQMELYDYDKDESLTKEGDRVKVVVIKED